MHDYADKSDDFHDGVGILVFVERWWIGIRAQQSDGNEVGATVDSGDGSRDRLVDRAQFKKMPETLHHTRCHPGRNKRRPAASKSAQSNLRLAGAVEHSPPSAVLRDSCSRCSTKAAKHGEGCAFKSFQKSC